MVKPILSSPQELVLEQALGASALRQRVIANNIANVNTPKFKRSDVVFEEKLAQAMGGKTTPLALARTHAGHLPGSRADGGFAPSVVTDRATSVRVDDNNVDIDAEMANVAKNSIYYNAVARELGTYFSNLKSVIRGGAS